MTALARPAAATVSLPEILARHWRHAEDIRQDWLAAGLATTPADRPLVETTITRLYARQSRPRPRFVWVDSPAAALSYLDGMPTHADLLGWITGRPADPARPGRPPITSDLAAGLSRLRSVLDAQADDPFLNGWLKLKKNETWPAVPPEAAVRLGVPLRHVLREHVRGYLERRLLNGIVLPIRAALPAPLPSAWYGSQDAAWIAYHDVLRQLGLARFPSAAEAHLEEWATLARSGGWWWPGESVCVVVERPSAIAPHRIEYRDGRRFTVPAPLVEPTGDRHLPARGNDGALQSRP